MKFSEKFQDTLLDLAEKVDSNQYLTATKNAFVTWMPFIVVGSFSYLFKILICDTSIGLARLIPAAADLLPGFMAVQFGTMSLMTLPITFLVAMNLAKHDKISQQGAGILALCSYIAIAPQTVTVAIEGLTGSGAGVPSSALGAQGLFVGMFIAILSEKFFARLMKIDKIKIKMPPTVPGAVTQSFNMLIPILIVLYVLATGGLLFRIATGSYLNDWIYKVVQAPLEVLFQSPLGVMALIVISQLFWFLGIHGGLVISPIRDPLMASALAANIAAVEAGGVATQVVTRGFWTFFTVAGGAGMILSLCLAIFIASKREDYRTIAKLGFVPALCGVSEPMVFGVPLVLNPTFAIPFIFNSCISTGIAMFAIRIGFMSCNVVDPPFGLPQPIAALIGWGWQGVVVQLICIAVTTLVWIPFVMVSNKQAVKEGEKA